jgi:NAD+ kinase
MIFGIFGNTAKHETAEVCNNLLSFLAKNEIHFVVHDQLGRILKKSSATPTLSRKSICTGTQLPGRCDILIALGGDGTMLEASRLIGNSGKPILGVNLGKLGFLAEVSTEEIRKCVLDILQGNYVVEDRMVLEAKSPAEGKRFFGLNDIVIDKGSSMRVIEIETYVNNDYLNTYQADGLILTTPTGSTAYSLATGGPLVMPESNVIIVNPISPHTLTARPVVVPDTSIIKVIVKAESGEVHLTADGQVEKFYRSPAKFLIKRANYTTRLVKRKSGGYYDLLRTKLMWGRDIRVKSSS